MNKNLLDKAISFIFKYPGNVVNEQDTSALVEDCADIIVDSINDGFKRGNIVIEQRSINFKHSDDSENNIFCTNLKFASAFKVTFGVYSTVANKVLIELNTPLIEYNTANVLFNRVYDKLSDEVKSWLLLKGVDFYESANLLKTYQDPFTLLFGLNSDSDEF